MKPEKACIKLKKYINYKFVKDVRILGAKWMRALIS
jgi:hypothetical protein